MEPGYRERTDADLAHSSQTLAIGWEDPAVLSTLDIRNFRRFDRYALGFSARNLLVGPNNAGKSTLIEALRLVSVVVNRFGALNYEMTPDWLDGIESSRGVMPSLRGLDFDLGRETFHQYADPPAVITAGFTGGSTVTVYLGPESDVFAVVRDDSGSAIATKGQARHFDQPKIAIQPQVGPLARLERPLADQYIRRSLDSTLAPSHFRNQLRLLPQYFDDFKAAAEETWPALRIDGVELMGRGDDCHLELFVRDGSFVGEVAAMGHGLQMWLQLMWFIARARDHGTIVLDEPDVYMHPDLQRRLVRFLLARDQQVVIATHSIEMMAEVEPTELLPIDGDKTRARPVRDFKEVQAVIDQVGGVHNIEFARLTQATRYLLISPTDLRLLKRWYDLGLDEAADALDLLPTFPLVAWDDWPYAIAMKRAMRAAGDSGVEAICLIGPGLRGTSELAERRGQAEAEGIDLHLWKRRELVNYLLVPEAIARAAREQTSTASPTDLEVADQLDRTLANSWPEVLDEATPDQRAALGREWESREGRLRLAPGRLVLLRLAAWLRRSHGCSVGTGEIQRSLRWTDLSPEIHAVVRALRNHDSVRAAGESATDIATWPSSANGSSAAGATEAETAEILDLFEAAGILGS